MAFHIHLASHPGFALSLEEGAHTRNGGKVHLWEHVAVNHPNQTWVYDARAGLIFPRAHPERVLSIGDGAHNGQLIHMWDRVGPFGNANQQWTMNQDGTIALRSNPGFLVSIEDHAQRNGGKVHLWERVAAGVHNQTWRASGVPVAIRLAQWRNHLLSLEEGAHTRNHGTVHMWEQVGEGHHNQTWTYDPFTGLVVPAAHPERVLSIEGRGGNGDGVWLWERVGPIGNDNQHWFLGPEGGLVIRKDGRRLSIESGGARNAGKVHMWESVGADGNENQRWSF